MCWEGKATAEGVVRGGGNQLLLEGGFYLGSSEELELVHFFTVRVLDLTAKRFGI